MTDEPSQDLPAQVDTSVPHSSRVWNYMLGGNDNFPVDRQAGDKFLETFPGMVDLARHCRQMLVRVVWHLAGEAGIRQFLDVGSGLPSADNVHEVAQWLAPDSRVVYVDNDPMVLAHSQALIVTAPEGATDYIQADARDAGTILREAARTLDFTQPTALMLMGILGLIPDYDEARSIVKRLMEPLPPGSYLAIYDGTDTDPAYLKAQARYKAEGAASPYTPRSPDQIARYFEGLELVEPGVVPVTRWRPEPGQQDGPPAVTGMGGVAYKP